MIISEIYKTYRINKGLQEHMLRVAAVGKMVCDASPLTINTEIAVAACLLHDMGNLIKSKIDVLPEFFEPEGVEYWSEVQKEMIDIYGDDVHAATNAMVVEIAGAGSVVSNTVAAASLDHLDWVQEKGTLEEKVLEYADMRVGLYGIISMHDRFDDIKNRYVPERWSKEELDRLEQCCALIEDELFAGSRIVPSDIIDESTAEIQKELLNFDIATQ